MPKCTPVRNVGSVILGRMLVISVQPKRYNFRRQKSFQSSRNPKDVPFVHESWLGITVWALRPTEDVHFIINITPCLLIYGSTKNAAEKWIMDK